MKQSATKPGKPSRRQFLRRAVTSASLLGLGGATGLLASPGDPAATVRGAKPGRALDDKFKYNLSSLTKTDPSLLQYEEIGQIATGFQEVRALAKGAEDHFYVAGDQAIRIFDKNGARSGEIALSDRPRCLARSSAGLLYVGMARHVEVYDAQGALQAKWANLGENTVLTALAVTEQAVFLADAGNRVVLKHDLAGNPVAVIGKKNPEKNVLGFVVPSPYFDLGIGPDGLLWVVNPARHRLEAYTQEGEFESAWGESANGIRGFCGCCNPVHFTRLADGRFVTSEKGLPRVKIYSAQGEFQGVVAGTESFSKQLENPKAAKVCMGLAIKSDGRILLADAVTRDVRIFSPKPTSEKKS